MIDFFRSGATKLKPMPAAYQSNRSNAELIKHGFYAPRWSMTINILAKLTPVKSNDVLLLLDKIRDHCKNKLKINVTLALFLPWAEALKALDMNTIVNNEAMMNQILSKRCIDLKAKRGPTVNLEPLPDIWQEALTPKKP